MIKSDIIKSFNPSMDDNNQRIVELYADVEDRLEHQKKLFKEFSEYLLEQHSKMKVKIEETELKVNNALFGDKKFFTETFTLDLPIHQDYFHSEVSITNGILTPTPRVIENSTKINIPISRITSRRETDFKIINNKLQIDKNLLFPYQELEIAIPKDIETGFFYLIFDRFEKVSVLNRFGKEIQDKAIVNQIVVPVSEKTNSLVIRFEDNKKKVFSIKEMYVSKNSFETSTSVETKPIIVNQYLKSIGINTCDNYSDPTVDIKYYISINEEAYREIRPINKQRNLELNSILSTDNRLHLLTLTHSIETDLGVKYPLDHLDTPLFYIQKAFKKKLGVNKRYKINNEDVVLYSEADIKVYLNNRDSVTLNSTRITATKDRHEVVIPKGFNILKVNDILWNQKEDLLKYEIVESRDSYLILRDKETGDTLYKDYSDPTEKGSFSLFLQLVNKADFYFEEYEATVSVIGEDKFVDKESVDDTFLFVKYKMKFIETIRIKIDLTTKDPKTPAYMSTLTIRGV